MKERRISIILFLLIAVLSIISLFVGVIDITGILAGDFKNLRILFISRMPRLMAIICTGVGMSIAGLIMQQLCMNKFVSPTTGATISCAQFGVMLSLLWFGGASLTQKTMVAFTTSVLGSCFFVYCVQKIKFKDIVMVPLIGIMFGNIVNGITSFYAYKYDLIQSLNSTIVGDFSLIIRGQYEIVFLTVPLSVLAYIYANHFNIVGMGENFAKNLGVHYKIVLFSGLSIAALITASIVVTIGSISYIGLIVPNIVAMFRGDRIRGNIRDVALFGALFVLLCDLIGRVIIFPYELPIELIVGIIGSLVFIGLMFKRLNTGVVKRPPKADHP